MRVASKIVDVLLEADEVDPKAFVTDRKRELKIEPYRSILVNGSYGTLHVDPYDGSVFNYTDFPADDSEEKGAQYADIVRFDLDELRRWIRANGSPKWAARADEIVKPGHEFDIVDIGFWTDKGEYVPAEEEHRRISWSDAEPG
jgi:hypothetical protein